MKNNCDNDLMYTPKITKRELELNDSKLELSMRTFAGCHTDTRVRQNVFCLAVSIRGLDRYHQKKLQYHNTFSLHPSGFAHLKITKNYNNY